MLNIYKYNKKMTKIISYRNLLRSLKKITLPTKITTKKNKQKKKEEMKPYYIYQHIKINQPK